MRASWELHALSSFSLSLRGSVSHGALIELAASYTAANRSGKFAYLYDTLLEGNANRKKC